MSRIVPVMFVESDVTSWVQLDSRIARIAQAKFIPPMLLLKTDRLPDDQEDI